MSQTTPRKSERLANSPTKSSPMKVSSLNIARAKASPTKNVPIRASLTMVSPAKASSIKVSPLKTDPANISSVNNSPTNSTPTKVSTIKISPTRVPRIGVSSAKISPTKVSPTKNSPNKSFPKRSPTKSSPTESSPTRSSRRSAFQQFDIFTDDHAPSSPPGSSSPQRRRPKNLQSSQSPPQPTLSSEGITSEGTVDPVKNFLDTLCIPCPLMKYENQFYEPVQANSKSPSYVPLSKETKDNKYSMQQLKDLYRWDFSSVDNTIQAKQGNEARYDLKWGETPLNDIRVVPKFDDDTGFSKDIEAHLQYLSTTMKDIQLFLLEEWREKEESGIQQGDNSDASRSSSLEDLQPKLSDDVNDDHENPTSLPESPRGEGDSENLQRASSRLDLSEQEDATATTPDKQERENEKEFIGAINRTIRRRRSVETAICWVSANQDRPLLDQIYNIIGLTCHESRGIIQNFPRVVRNCMDGRGNPKATSEMDAENLFAGWFWNDLLSECHRWKKSRNKLLKFPPHLKLVDCDTKPDGCLRAESSRVCGSSKSQAADMLSWPGQFLPALFVAECKPEDKDDPEKTRAQCAASAQATLIELILFYLDTRKSPDEPAPWWLFVPGIDYTENGFVIAAHYPCRITKEGRPIWGFRSVVITDRFKKVFKAPERTEEETKPAKGSRRRKRKDVARAMTGDQPENGADAEVQAEAKVDIEKEEEYAPSNSKGRVQSLAAFLILMCHASKLLDELCKWDPGRAELVLNNLREPALKAKPQTHEQKDLCAPL